MLWHKPSPVLNIPAAFSILNITNNTKADKTLLCNNNGKLYAMMNKTLNRKARNKIYKKEEFEKFILSIPPEQGE